MSANGQLAVIFPGQGSQVPGMGDAVRRELPRLGELATELVEEDPFERLDDGTRFVQPAIFCASLALWTGLGRPSADLLAGHSLGELAALVAAGAIGAEDGLRAVVVRGRLMQEAAEAVGDGRMLACRATPAEAEPIARRAGVTIANVNDPRQVVLSGAADAIADASGALGAAGVRTKVLPVAGAFHSAAMAGAATSFRAFLAQVEVRPLRVPVMRCATATPFADVRAELAAALTLPVQWLEVMRALHRAGARRFLEPGPGKVLTGLVRRSLDGVDAEAGAELEPAGV